MTSSRTKSKHIKEHIQVWYAKIIKFAGVPLRKSCRISNSGAPGEFNLSVLSVGPICVQHTASQHSVINRTHCSEQMHSNMTK